MSIGKYKFAEVAFVPLPKNALAAFITPAYVETIPPVIFRTTFAFGSEVKKLPLMSSNMVRGPLKEADIAGTLFPALVELPLPAIVEI